jgi:hypothetical protein
MKAPVKQIARKLHTARSISFFGSAFSDLVLPLFIYEITKSPMLLGMQWAIQALFRLFAGRLAGHISLWKSDRAGLISLDVLQGAAAIIPLLLWKTAPAFGTYVTGITLSVLATIQAGYIDSIVGNTAKNTSEPDSIRTWLNAKLENGRNWGLFIGYTAAWLTTTYAGFQMAIILDSLTFILSAAITATLPASSNHTVNPPPKASYSLLFQHNKLIFLTISQAMLSFAVYIFNATFIFTMKHTFSAPNGAIAALLIFQAACYMLGSHFAAKYSFLKTSTHAALRFAFVGIYLGFACTSHYIGFIAWNAALSCLISFTQPGILSLFQSFADSTSRRALGSARTSIMAVAGSIGAATSGIMLQSYSHSSVFIIAAISASFGACFFLIFHRLPAIETA